jgi:ABC-2 type transport system permease protein
MIKEQGFQNVLNDIKFLGAFYPLRMKYAALIAFQYRLGSLLWVVGLIIEPVIYLVIWTTVAREQGGEIGSYTVSEFTAYYFVWTILRVMNIGLHPGAFEWRVRNGRWSHLLLRPMHPIHDDIAFLSGQKTIDLIMLVPILIGLGFAFRPALEPTSWQIVLFVIACLLGFLVRTIWQWALGLVTFWVIRVQAIFDLYFAIELLLSGRIVPLDLLPEWAQNVANFLPYQWSFAFPIEVAIGRQTLEQSLSGLGIQLAWIIGGWFFVMFLWRKGVKRYSAVGA